ncbi:MAG: hypothetical protein HYV93_16190 [Candidatus Rokubacteria bacterium]|nr:hypothetical protein [Candidatus Rokubacteria bacterium]
MRRRSLSLSRTFALMSLVIIGLITALQVVVQWTLLRDDLLEWERTVSADAIRTEAYSLLRADDFRDWRNPVTQERFDRVFRRALGRLEIRRIKLYDPDMRVIWSDEARLVGIRFPGNAGLAEALRGSAVARLERARQAENLYEWHFTESVELYVPLSFSPGATPGTASIVGVVEVYKNPAPALANLWRDRWTIVITSLAGAVLLYAVLFGMVHRASRQLEVQRRNLERQAIALSGANLELREAQKQLRAAERLAAIGEVSAAVAHGIRNPLANIRAAAQVALDRVIDRAVTEKYLASIMAEVDRLGRWLRALLDSVRPFELRAASMDLGAVLEEVLSLLGERIASRQVTVERHLAPDLPRLVADEVQLQQAFLGVLENAVDALSAGGVLRVQAERLVRDGQSWVRVTIQDTGEGIPQERLGHIFEPFYTTKNHGTGLGLAITRRVVEGHGGSVEVESKRGVGTTVLITLPVESGPPPGS